MKPEYCPCQYEKPDPFPECGATVSGKDKVRGICQAIRGYRMPPDVILVVVDRETGEIV